MTLSNPLGTAVSRSALQEADGDLNFAVMSVNTTVSQNVLDIDDLYTRVSNLEQEATNLDMRLSELEVSGKQMKGITDTVKASSVNNNVSKQISVMSLNAVTMG